MVGTLIDRPVIHKDFQHNYAVLIRLCSKELDEAKCIFDRLVISYCSVSSILIFSICKCCLETDYVYTYRKLGGA